MPQDVFRTHETIMRFICETGCFPICATGCCTNYSELKMPRNEFRSIYITSYGMRFDLSCLMHVMSVKFRRHHLSKRAKRQKPDIKITSYLVKLILVLIKWMNTKTLGIYRVLFFVLSELNNRLSLLTNLQHAQYR